MGRGTPASLLVAYGLSSGEDIISVVAGIEIWRFQKSIADSKEDEWVSGGGVIEVSEGGA